MKRIIATLLSVIGIASIAWGANPKPADKSQADQGSVIVVFKDGHRQSFRMADVARIEFSGVEGRTAAKGRHLVPGRNHFVGKWRVGDGNGRDFFITLKEDGNAEKTIGAAHGAWDLVNGEAQITWDDGARDAIRKVGSKHEKLAYLSGKTFSDPPTNVTNAEAMDPKTL